jgi:hypothetical protein
MLGNSLVAEQLAASLEGLGAMELVNSQFKEVHNTCNCTERTELHIVYYLEGPGIQHGLNSYIIFRRNSVFKGLKGNIEALNVGVHPST